MNQNQTLKIITKLELIWLNIENNEMRQKKREQTHKQIKR